MTIPQLFENSVEKFPNNTLVLEKDKSRKYQPLTYLQIQDSVYNFAKGLKENGVEFGDRLALLSEGRSEWLISELGMLYIGAIDVPLSVKINELKDLSFRINHSECKYIVVSERQIKKVREIKSELKNLEKVIIILDSDLKLESDEISYDKIIELGKKSSIEIAPIWQS